MLAREIAKRGARILLVLLAVGVVTAFYRLTAFANHTTVALTFLLIVLAAAVWGLVEAVVASLVATLCFNYFFIPPVGTWTVADPQNWVALFVFLAVSIVASQLSERTRRMAQHAIEQRQETERLYTLSRMILMVPGNASQVAEEITRHVQQVFEAQSVALAVHDSGQVFHTGSQPLPLSDAQLKEIALQGNIVEDAKTGFVALPVSLGGKTLGVLAILGASLSDGARHAVTNLIAIALEGARNRAIATEAYFARQSEEFKSTLLDALAHDLKTPLTSVKASIGALLDGASGASANQRELLSIIAEETDRLTRLVTEALQMARIEAGKLKLERHPCLPEALIRDAIEDSKRLLEGREVQVRAQSNLPAVSADAELVGTVLRHLLDNAAKYSPPGTPVRIQAQTDNAHIRITVADHGPGISERELSSVFEKYYRGARTRDEVPGVGLGLAIAKDIVIAHGGRMWAESLPGQGARVHFTLPLAEDGSQA